MTDADVNHLYAGKTLTFEIEIADVPTATNEELAQACSWTRLASPLKLKN